MRHVLARCLGLGLVQLLLLCLCAAPARAQSPTLESALSPGALIQGHAMTEHDCMSCHIRFDRSAQDGL